MTKHIKILTIGLLSSFMFGCSSKNVVYIPEAPKNFRTTSIKTTNKQDACKMMVENPDWLHALQKSHGKWGTPISIQLSFVYHESSFVYNARPIKKKKGYAFGTEYASSALGFSQALNGAWGDYKNELNPVGAKRTNFGDSVDFIGWYNSKSHKIGIKPVDAYNLYLAYHEGRRGWQKGYHKKQKWLLNYAKSVQKKSEVYSTQINNCNLRIK